MNIKKIYAILTVCILAFGITAAAQDAVKWRTTVKMTSDTEGMLTVKAIIAEPWHLYGMQMPANGPKPTVLDFSASKGVKFIGDFKPSVKAVTKIDPLFEAKISYWTGIVSFTRKFRLTGDKAKALLSGKITYMACDDTNCLPPTTQSVTLRIK